MERIFLRVLNMSITSSYVILFVIGVRLLLKRVPKVFSYILWVAVLFRLVCPFSFAGLYSLLPINTETIPRDIMYAKVPQVDSGVAIIDRSVNNLLPAPSAGASVNPMQIWLTLGAVVWLAGVVVLLIYSFFTTIRLYRRLKTARHIFANLYETEATLTPFIFGFFRPKIYLPPDLLPGEKEYIIRHEQTHIKRYDHIIKACAFLALCIHWFNPLVWVAYFLMAEDMEQSCDESVIKALGSSIKKDYSTSLLSLSTGRRIVAGCPLTFAESSIRGRIRNILNYKQPALWVAIATLIVVAVIVVGLMANPGAKGATVEFFAEKFITDVITANDTSGRYFKIIDRKITRLEKITVLEELLPCRVEIWRLEYRLKPEDRSKIIFAGGMNEIDGWITEDASMGKPFLVFSYEKDVPQFLGTIWSGEEDLSSPAGQEIAVRKLLEREGLLPPETYGGKHIIVKFPLSTGETSQLLLSQPAAKGEHGIWCVERWMDGSGTVYHVIPQTDLTTREYYKKLQAEVDEGHKPWLIDPLQVALEWIRNELGQNASITDLEPQHSVPAEAFLQIPESRYIGFITDFENDKYSKPSFHLYPVEWLTLKDSKRLAELGIDPNELANGFYIHEPDPNYPVFLQVEEATQYRIIKLGEDASHTKVTLEEFVAHLAQFSDYVPPFWVVTRGGYVQSITEQYVP